MVNSRSPVSTLAPSSKPTLTSSPDTCDFTWITAEASTVPTALSSTGTDSSLALATLTGTGGGGPPAFFWSVELHPASRIMIGNPAAIATQRLVNLKREGNPNLNPSR